MFAWNTKRFEIACVLQNCWHNYQLLRFRERQNALKLPVFFFSFLCLVQPYPEYWGIRSKKFFLQTVEQLIQYIVLEILFWYLKYNVVIKMCKILSNFPFLSKRYKVIAVCWCKQSTPNSFQTWLYILTQMYDKSVILLQMI